MHNKKPRHGELRGILRYVGRYPFLAALSFLLALGTVFGTLYIPALVGSAIDQIVAPGQVNFSAIMTILLKIALIAAFSAILQWLLGDVNNRLSLGVVRDLRHDAFHKLERLPLRYIDSHAHGDLLNRMIADADAIGDGLLLGFSQFFSGVVTIAAALGFMLRLNPRIALVVVALTPLSLLIARFLARRSYGMFLEQSKTRGEQTAYVNEAIDNLKLVQAFSQEAPGIERFDEIAGRLERCSRRAIFLSSLPNPSTRFVNSMIYAAVCLTGGLAAIASPGALSVGQLTAFLSYVLQYTKPFNDISGVITELQNALACARRLLKLIEAQEEPSDASGTVLTSIEGNVSLQNVDFSYSSDKTLIEDLNLSVQPGQRIAIVGPTGCGKTTLVNLLMRFYDVTGGSIQIENQDIRDLTRDSLRACYGMVLQDTWIKTATVRENIRLGRPKATDAEVEQAARLSHAHSFIRRLSEGYDTIVSNGEGGLSQGEKQLLSIARVMLCLPPMLILDEATSSIDTRTELKIQSAFARLMEGRTSFIVAHRLSTIREADLILVMRDGKIIEQGSHADLLQQNGFYTKLYNQG